MPASLVIAPQDTTATVGDRIRYRMEVLDRRGEAIEVPSFWDLPEWSVEDTAVARISADGHLDPESHAITQVRVSFAGLRASTGVRVNPRSLVVRAPAFHVTQGVQDDFGKVPLIAGREGLLRVFVTGDRGSFHRPRVLASFYHDDRLAHFETLELGAIGLPTETSPGSLESSYNAHVPAWVLRPGTGLAIDVDPDGVLPEQPDGPLRIPAEGRFPLDVRSVPDMELTVVPVLGPSDPEGAIRDWTAQVSADSDHLRLVRSVFPIAALDVEVHEGFATSSDLSKGAGWGELLGDLTFLRIREGGTGYWYGAMILGDDANWEGLGYIGYPVGVGAADPETLAHEIGHNLNLRHAPCGGAIDPDGRFPFEDGAIGVWGYDFHERKIVSPFLYRDVMGYCDPNWISDYSFNRALFFRLEMEAAVLHRSRADASAAPGAGRTLLLMGRVQDGALELDPSFMVDLPATLPAEEGPYRLAGLGPSGEVRFSFRFSPRMTAYGAGHFLFAVPFDPAVDGALDEVALSGPEGFATLRRGESKPMAMITDRASGKVRGILRDWDGSTLPGAIRRLARGAEIVVSEGLPDSERRR